MRESPVRESDEERAKRELFDGREPLMNFLI